MKKGDIYLIDLEGNVGSEQGGVRPCVVVQNDKGNKFSPTTIVCPITTTERTYSATHMDVNLLKPSCIMFEQVRAIDKTRIKKYLCKLDRELFPELNRIIALTFDL